MACRSMRTKERKQQLQEGGLQQQQFYIQKLKSQRQKIQNLREDFDRRIEQLQEKQRLISRINKDLSSYSTLRADHQKLLTDVDRQHFQINRLKKERDQLKDRVHSHNSTNIKEQVDKLREQAQELNRQLSVQEQNEQYLQKQLSNAKLQKARLISVSEEHVVSFKNRWNALKVQYQTAKAHQLQDKAALSLLNQDLLQLTADLQIAQAQHAHAKKRASQSQSAKAELEQELLRQLQSVDKGRLSFEKQMTQREIEFEKVGNIIGKQRTVLAELKNRQVNVQNCIRQSANQDQQHLHSLHKLQQDSKIKNIRLAAHEDELRSLIKAFEDINLARAHLERDIKGSGQRKVQQGKMRGELQQARERMQQERQLQVERIEDLFRNFKNK